MASYSPVPLVGFHFRVTIQAALAPFLDISPRPPTSLMYTQKRQGCGQTRNQMRNMDLWRNRSEINQRGNLQAGPFGGGVGKRWLQTLA
jgi:hypothetical protein